MLALGLLLVLGACAAPGGGIGSAPGQAAGPAVARPALRSADLVGWSGSDLQGRFGPPMLTFAEPPAEVWRYSAAHCVALFFLYPAGAAQGGAGTTGAVQGGPALVRHVEVLPRDGTGGDSACLQQIGARGTV